MVIPFNTDSIFYPSYIGPKQSIRSKALHAG